MTMDAKAILVTDKVPMQFSHPSLIHYLTDPVIRSRSLLRNLCFVVGLCDVVLQHTQRVVFVTHAVSHIIAQSHSCRTLEFCASFGENRQVCALAKHEHTHLTRVCQAQTHDIHRCTSYHLCMLGYGVMSAASLETALRTS